MNKKFTYNSYSLYCVVRNPVIKSHATH